MTYKRLNILALSAIFAFSFSACSTVPSYKQKIDKPVKSKLKNIESLDVKQLTKTPHDSTSR